MSDKTGELEEFESVIDALDWMRAQVNDPCIDNERVAACGDEVQVRLYEWRIKNGCCKTFDQKVLVRGILVTVGCNFGHRWVSAPLSGSHN